MKKAGRSRHSKCRGHSRETARQSDHRGAKAYVSGTRKEMQWPGRTLSRRATGMTRCSRQKERTRAVRKDRREEDGGRRFALMSAVCPGLTPAQYKTYTTHRGRGAGFAA